MNFHKFLESNSCPNCGTICSDKTIISKTECEFETIYFLHNGT